MFQPMTTETHTASLAVENPAARELFEERFYDVTVLLNLLGEARRFQAQAA